MTLLSTRKTALITGGAARLGKALSVALSKDYNVAIHYNKSHESALRLKDTLLGSEIFKSDLLRPKEPAKLINRVMEHFGRLDLIINNAGIFINDKSDIVDLAKMKILNFDAPNTLIESALVYLKANKGSIINIADIAGLHPFKEYKFYSKTKAQLIDTAKKRALELAKIGIRINTICPGIISIENYESDNNKKKELIAGIPLGKFGSADDIADTVMFLAKATFITGQIISVDGGRLLNYSY